MSRYRGMAFMFACLWISFPFASRAADAEHPEFVLTEYPGFEGFLGVSVINSPFDANRLTLSGYHMSFALNPKSYLRLTGEFAGHYGNTGIQSNLSEEKVRLAEYQFLGGPEFVLRRKNKATPFVRTLFGVAARHFYIPSNDPRHPRDVLAVDYGFASALGCGVDITLSRRWALRAAQFDYLLTHLAYDLPQYSPIQDQLPSLEAWQHNYRFSFGLVVRLDNGIK